MRYVKAIPLILALLLFLAGCSEVVSETPIDTECSTAYDAMEMVYEYKYDWYHGDFVYLPVYKMVHHDAVYRVQYKVTYSDGNTYVRWRTVDEDEYEKAVEQIGGQDEAGKS